MNHYPERVDMAKLLFIWEAIFPVFNLWLSWQSVRINSRYCEDFGR